MKWIAIFFILFTGLSFVGQDEEISWVRNLETALSKSKSKNKAIVVYFGADWCAPCKITESKVFSKSEFVKFTNNYVMLKVYDDYKAGEKDKYDYMNALKERYNVTSIPLFIVLKNGKEKYRFSGMFRDPKELIKKIKATG